MKYRTTDKHPLYKAGIERTQEQMHNNFRAPGYPGVCISGFQWLREHPDWYEEVSERVKITLWESKLTTDVYEYTFFQGKGKDTEPPIRLTESQKQLIEQALNPKEQREVKETISESWTEEENILYLFAAWEDTEANKTGSRTTYQRVGEYLKAKK